MGSVKLAEEIYENYYERMKEDYSRGLFPGCVGNLISNANARSISAVKKRSARKCILFAIHDHCVDCGAIFCLSIEEQKDYALRGLEFPKRCRCCRASYKIRMLQAR